MTKVGDGILNSSNALAVCDLLLWLREQKIHAQQLTVGEITLVFEDMELRRRLAEEAGGVEAAEGGKHVNVNPVAELAKDMGYTGPGV